MNKYWESIEPNSIMFDFEEYYSKVAENLPNNCKIAEIGIANCKSVIFLAEKIISLNKKIERFVLVDNLQYGNNVQLQTIMNNLIKSGVGEHCDLIIKDSLEASFDFPSNYFDHIFIDSSHTYLQTKKEIPAWYEKVKDEGILAGHDYNAPEVKQAVDETIPTYFVRTDIADRTFEPEKVLHTENTNNGWGLWWLRKQWYLSLNK